MAMVKRPRFRQVIRAAMALLVLILLLPFALTLLYATLAPVSTVMLWRWAKGEHVERIWVPLDRVAPALVVAVLVAEDTRYCRHHGVDLESVVEIMETEDLREARGGSSITQQTAKNLFLWPSRSLFRKALEFPLALWVDRVLGKRRVLEIYLNIAEWGPDGEFGIEAAARRAFGKSAAELDPHEAALLAAVLPNPHRRDARQPGVRLGRLAAIYRSRAATFRGVASCILR
jgi:monofunctional biosynthetic peptidoglycan transglycosylase